MMRNAAYSPSFANVIGLDRLVSLSETLARTADGGYPPYNVLRSGEDEYRIEVAVAGFAAEELSVETKEKTLIVSGNKEKAEKDKEEAGSGFEYVHQGISARGFKRRFELADYVEVKGASLSDGILAIDLRREVPEHQRQRKVDITVRGPAPNAAAEA